MWEYDYIEFQYETKNELIEKLNQLGKENWEIIDFIEIEPKKFGEKFICKIIVKRKKRISL